MTRPPGFLLLPLLLFHAGCGGEGNETHPEGTPSAPVPEAGTAEPPIRVQDATGRVLTFSARPRRIVSLVPSASETLLSLGVMDRMVGRTDFDTARAFRGLPSVGGGLHPNAEAIVSLEPDLVIRFAGDSDAATPRRLDQMGIPHLAIRPGGIPDIRKIISDLGKITGRRERADSLLGIMDSTLADIGERVRGRPRPRVAYLLGGTPPWVAGPGSFIEELLTAAGGENVFSDLGEIFGPVNAEVFLVREIDVLLAASDAEVSIPEIGLTVHRVSSGIEIPGPHLADAASEIARILHPEVFR